jgi:hypothetical protein
MAAQARKPASEAELQTWIQSMIWYHHYSDEEISIATGFTLQEVTEARTRFDINVNNRPERPAGLPIHIEPYPGGRHPRIQFLEGAVNPQRETKVSVFTSWDDTSYVVADVPEAIWSNLGLTYLAHTHVPTLWTQQNVELEQMEWKRLPKDGLEIERHLPNGIVFGARVMPEKDQVTFEMWLTNGTAQPLSDLRVQNCVMLKGATGFEQLTNDNKVFQAPYAACRDASGKRWVISAWDHPKRAWGNPPCPCLHSDPQFPDCPPGETRRLVGRLSFYEGTDIQAELKRIEALGWRRDAA